MKRILCATLLVAAASAVPAAAKEFYVGEPVVKNDMQLVPHYLRGFKEDEWIPNLTISYTIEKVGTKLEKAGQLLPMTAADGPHYANNVALTGDGDYQVTFHFEPPSKAGFVRHVDKATGVPDWWQPFSQSWTFHFPRKPAE